MKILLAVILIFLLSCSVEKDKNLESFDIYWNMTSFNSVIVHDVQNDLKLCKNYIQAKPIVERYTIFTYGQVLTINRFEDWNRSFFLDNGKDLKQSLENIADLTYNFLDQIAYTNYSAEEFNKECKLFIKKNDLLLEEFIDLFSKRLKDYFDKHSFDKQQLKDLFKSKKYVIHRFKGGRDIPDNYEDNLLNYYFKLIENKLNENT